MSGEKGNFKRYEPPEPDSKGVEYSNELFDRHLAEATRYLMKERGISVNLLPSRDILTLYLLERLAEDDAKKGAVRDHTP